MMPSPDDPIDDQSILDEEWALRRVHPVIAPNGHPDRSLFKAGREGIGTSVTLCRTAEDIQIIKRGFEIHGVVAIPVGAFREHGLGIMFTVEDGNPNHCEVFGGRTKPVLKHLSSQARWVVRPQGVGEDLIPTLFDPLLGG